MQAYDKDYFENGVEAGVSCYENYRWMPELTLQMCNSIATKLKLQKTDKILDYGCAKGFIVRAFQELGFTSTKGVDISEYAIRHCDETVKGNLQIIYENWPLSLQLDEKFDWLICKDVLEHIDKASLQNLLQEFKRVAKNVFIVVPQGKNGKYFIDEHEQDVTHKIREDIYWWCYQLQIAGFEIQEATAKMPGVKDNWAQYENGNAFLIARAQ